MAAGKGSRLHKLSKNKHKSLLPLNKKDNILGKLVKQFLSLGCLSKNIYFITGYKFKQIERYFGKRYRFFYYKNFKKTNNLHTLISAQKFISVNETIISFSDIVIENRALKELYNRRSKNICILADTSYVRNGTMKIQLDKKKYLKKIGIIPKKISDGNYVGLLKIPKSKIRLFKQFLINAFNMNRNSYFTEVLNELIKKNNEKIEVLNVDKSKWIEVDNIFDYKKTLNRISSFY